MLQTIQATLSEAGRLSHLNEQQLAEFCQPDAVWHQELGLGQGSTFSAFRIQHNNRYGPYKGGIRYHPQTDADEVQALATLMSLKTATVGLPLGGGKGGLSLDPNQLNPRQLEDISRAYVRAFINHLGPDKDIPAPDVNTNPQIMDWMADEYAKLTGDNSGAGFSGKSLDKGGSLGRVAATGRGGLSVLDQVLKLQGDKRPLKVAVQGFGNVGSHFVTLARQHCPQLEIVALADQSSTLTGSNQPLPLDKIIGWRQDNPTATLDRFSSLGLERLPAEAVLGLPVDVLVLAALGDAITSANQDEIRADYLLELANGPIDTAATAQLEARGALIIPSILASSGGVIVSYFEYCQNLGDEQWPEARVNQQLEVILSGATQDIWDCGHYLNMNLRQAAYVFSLQQFFGHPDTFAPPLATSLGQHYLDSSRAGLNITAGAGHPGPGHCPRPNSVCRLAERSGQLDRHRTPLRSPNPLLPPGQITGQAPANGQKGPGLGHHRPNHSAGRALPPPGGPPPLPAGRPPALSPTSFGLSQITQDNL